MPFPLSPRTIDAIAEVISGGSATDGQPPIGIYRSGPKLTKFMRSCGVEFQVTGSRVPSLVNRLTELNEDQKLWPLLEAIIVESVDPRDFQELPPERKDEPVAYLNTTLAFDGLELKPHGPKMRLIELGLNSPAVGRLSRIAEELSFDTVSRDLDRALESVKKDPEDAITGACSTLESVFRSILVEMGLPLPNKKDVYNLYRALKGSLGLSFEQTDPTSSNAQDIAKILTGLSAVVEGIGALRTHNGDAHGRERGYRRVDARIASLAVHSSSAIALFCIETWQRKFPGQALRRHDEPISDLPLDEGLRVQPQPDTWTHTT